MSVPDTHSGPTSYPSGVPMGPYASLNPKDLAETAKISSFVSREDKQLIGSIIPDQRIYAVLIDTIIHLTAQHIRTYGLTYGDGPALIERLQHITIGDPIGSANREDDGRPKVQLRGRATRSPNLSSGDEKAHIRVRRGKA